MVTVREDLERVLGASKERVRISRVLRNQSRESIHRSHQAVLHSQEVITRSDRVIEDINKHQHPDEQKQPAHLPGGPGNLLQRIVGQTLTNQVLVMDGKHFVDCSIINCVLEYNGQALVMETTEFSGCSFRFKSEAALTLNFLDCFGLGLGRNSDYTVAPTEPVLSQRPN